MPLLGPVRSWDWRASWTLAGVLALGAALRVLFNPGLFGSDDTVYLREALRLAEGRFDAGQYIGNLRYGINALLALSVELLGVTRIASVLPFFVFSLAEIALVFVFARHVWGIRTGTHAALLLAFTPIHVMLGGGPLPDPYLAFFITATFVAFWYAERHAQPSLYVLAGLLGGYCFWIKEVVVVFLLAFIGYAIAQQRFASRWLWMIGSAVAVGLSNLIFFWIVFDDPFYVARIVRSTVDSAYLEAGLGEKSPVYYFYYLFLDIRHTTLLSVLATSGLCYAWLSRGTRDLEGQGARFVGIWLLGLLAVFSFFPISFSPLEFIAKQTNYMTLFLAPLALLAAWFLRRLSSRWQYGLLVVTFGSGLILAALEQQAIRVHTANAKAVTAFSLANQEPVYGSRRASNVSFLYSAFRGDRPPKRSVQLLARLPEDLATGRTMDRFVAADEETMNWNEERSRLGVIARCLTDGELLDPIGFGIGREVLGTILRISPLLLSIAPQGVSDHVQALLERYYRPQPVRVLRLDGRCAKAALAQKAGASG